jgi:hypothetical protein
MRFLCIRSCGLQRAWFNWACIIAESGKSGRKHKSRCKPATPATDGSPVRERWEKHSQLDEPQRGGTGFTTGNSNTPCFRHSEAELLAGKIFLRSEMPTWLEAANLRAFFLVLLAHPLAQKMLPSIYEVVTWGNFLWHSVAQFGDSWF